MSRGGARTGAGRKISTEARRVTISFRVTEDIRDAIQQLRAEGTDVNKILENTFSLLLANDNK